MIAVKLPNKAYHAGIKFPEIIMEIYYAFLFCFYTIVSDLNPPFNENMTLVVWGPTQMKFCDPFKTYTHIL